MTRVAAYVCGAVGAVLALLSIFVLSWAHYGDFAIELSRFTGWPVYVVSVLGLQTAVAWVLSRRPGARIGRWSGLASGLVAAASAIMLGLRYDNSGDFFGGPVPLVMPRPGLGPYAAVLAVLVSLFALGAGSTQRDNALPSTTPLSPTSS